MELRTAFNTSIISTQRSLRTHLHTLLKCSLCLSETHSERKEATDIKTKIIEKTGFDEVMMVDDSLLSGHSSDYNTIKDNDSVS